MEITHQSENVEQMEGGEKNDIRETFKVMNLLKQRGVW